MKIYISTGGYKNKNINSILSKMEKNNIVYLKGDWTNQDKEITSLLNEHNRNGVPLYLMYPKNGGSPEVLPQILLEQTLLEAIRRAI